MAIKYHRATHRFTHAPILYLESDTAWNRDKIEADRKRIEAGEDTQWLTWDAHPVARYREGASRFDVATISAWLQTGESPTPIKLRRMTFAQWEVWQAHLEAVRPGGGGSSRQLMYALRHGFDRVELEPGYVIEAGPNGLTDAQLDTLKSELGDAQFIEVAVAASRLQQSLTPDEAFR